ncbi:type III polyketide synthase [Myxococcota bacterium]|nr:type III polyketide synthase [Myxococcota bacterium]
MTHTYETLLAGVGTATPRFAASQDEVAALTAEVVSSRLPPAERDRVARRARALFARSGVGARQSVIPDFGPGPRVLFPPNAALEPFPTTRARMELFARESVPLATCAAERALADAAVRAQDVTHVVTTTCTGFFAPGPDVALVEALGVPRSAARTMIGFMGCHAGFAAIRAADAIVRADRDAIVLTVSVELCSLHFQRSSEPGSLVAMALFGDGASAAVWGATKRLTRSRAAVRGTATAIAPDTRDEMTWTIGDHGFVMHLSPKVPDELHTHAPRFFDALATRARLVRDRHTRFCVHPGGPRIIGAIRDALALEPGDVETSLAVLRDHGNLSSAAILFVLERELARGSTSRDVVLLGFGPGLAMEGAVLHVGGLS